MSGNASQRSSRFPPTSSSFSNKSKAPAKGALRSRVPFIKEENPSVETPISGADGDGATVNLQSNDGKIFPVRLEVARCFGIVRNMVDHCIIKEGVSDPEPVPLARVSGPILQLAITWAEHHHVRHPEPTTVKVKVEDGTGGSSITDDDTPEIYCKRPNSVLPKNDQVLPSSLLTRTMDDLEYWDRQFLGNLTPGKLQDLLEAANYLDSQELLESTCKMVAKMIKGVLDLDGPEGVADFVQVPQVVAEEEEELKAKAPAPTAIAAIAGPSGRPSGSKKKGVGAQKKPPQPPPEAPPAVSVNRFLSTRASQQNKPPEKNPSKPIKKEGEDEGIRWVGLVAPAKNANHSPATIREASSEVSVQEQELRAEVANAFAAD